MRLRDGEAADRPVVRIYTRKYLRRHRPMIAKRIARLGEKPFRCTANQRYRRARQENTSLTRSRTSAILIYAFRRYRGGKSVHRRRERAGVIFRGNGFPHKAGRVAGTRSTRSSIGEAGDRGSFCRRPAAAASQHASSERPEMVFRARLLVSASSSSSSSSSSGVKRVNICKRGRVPRVHPYARECMHIQHARPDVCMARL